MNIMFEFLICVFLIIYFTLIIKDFIKQRNSRKHKLYILLNNIFEEDIIQYKNELIEYALKTKLMVKNKNIYSLTDSGLLYIKDYSQNFIMYLLAQYSIIVSVFALLYKFF